MTVLECEDGAVSGIGRADGALELGDGWAMRLAQGSRGRLALEVYADERLLDVMVESALTSELLRGARRMASVAPVLAWGLLPVGGGAPLVRFGRGPAVGTAPRIVADRFWLALGDADAERVAVSARAGAGWEELRVSPVR